MAAPVSPYAQTPDDGGLQRAYEQASSYSPITKEDLTTAYKPYGMSVGTVGRKSTDKSLYDLASQRVVDWWKKRQADAAAAKAAAAKPVDPKVQQYADALAAARAKGQQIGTYKQWYDRTFAPKPAATTVTAPKPAAAPAPAAKSVDLGALYAKSLAAAQADGKRIGSYAQWVAAGAKPYVAAKTTQTAATSLARYGTKATNLMKVIAPAPVSVTSSTIARASSTPPASLYGSKVTNLTRLL